MKTKTSYTRTIGYFSGPLLNYASSLSHNFEFRAREKLQCHRKAAANGACGRSTLLSGIAPHRHAHRKAQTAPPWKRPRQALAMYPASDPTRPLHQTWLGLRLGLTATP